MIRSRLRGRAVRALPIALTAGAIAVTLGACGATNPAGPPAEAVADPPEPSTVATVADVRTEHLSQALAARGFPAVVPHPTLLALADGVCRQIAAGTPDSEILTHLRPTAAYAASQSGGVLTAERATRLLLDSTRSDFC